MRTNLRPERPGDRAAERRLADAWRPDEAQNGAFHAFDERQHADIVEDAILHFLEPVVIFVEDPPRVRHVEHVVGPLGPGQRDDPVYKISGYRGLGRQRRHPAQLTHLAQGARLDRLRELARLDLSFEVARVVGILLAQLAVDRLELLVQVELALVLEQRAAHFLVELSLEAKQFGFAHQQLVQGVEQRGNVGCLEQRLPDLDANREVRRDAVGLAPDRIRALYERDDFVGNAPMERDVLLEEREYAARQYLERLGVRVLVSGVVVERRAKVAGGRDVSRHARAAHAFDEDARRAVRLPRRLNDARDDADAMQVAGRGLLGVRALLRDEEERAAVGSRRLDRVERRLPSDEQRHGDVRKDDDVAQRQYSRSLYLGGRSGARRRVRGGGGGAGSRRRLWGRGRRGRCHDKK